MRESCMVRIVLFFFLLSEKQPLKNENLYEKERSVFHYQPCSFIEIVIIALKM